MAGGEPAKRVRPDLSGGTEERRLVEAAQRDPARFGELYEIHFDLIYAYVARRVRDRSETEDLTSEVFRKGLAGLPRFKWTGAPFAAWLLRIASNMIADRAKRSAKQDLVDLPEAQRQQTVASEQTQQTDLEGAERTARLFKSVDELPEDQRRVLLMRFAGEKSIREIANELGRSEGAVKQLQFRALETLRKNFGGQAIL
jgi:RNA polymerase sigma-70 factor, ECF subfamily